jgi:hypothetical protein
LAAKAVGDFAIDRAGAQRAFGAVVGRAEIAVGDEDEEIGPDLFDDRLELAPGAVGWDQAHEAVEAPVQIGLIGFQRGVGEIVASSADGAGALQQTLHAGREHDVAGVDGILNVADEVREADLMLALGPAHLAAVAVRDPVIGTKVAQKGLDHRFGAMFIGDEDGAVGMVEHPQPPVGLAGTTLVASFANGVTKDIAAVSAAITSGWSNGQTEGQICKLKLVKRQMYGRGKLDLLQARVIGFG